MLEWPVINSIQFAKQYGEVRCSIHLSELKRLAQVALSDNDEFRVCLEGFEDSEGRACLRLRVDGSVTLPCQRCLEPLVLGIASDRRFVLVEREQDLMDLGDEADDVDSLLADSKLDALMLAEDEILLQIPMAPMHDNDLCKLPEWSGDVRNDGSAFGVLGALTNSEE